jgi:ATP-dependent Clp protease ATP-binding subunit ClpC
MFERYTESARRTLFYARYEASQLGGDCVEPEHILLGMLRESGAIVGRLFVAADVSHRGFRQVLDSLEVSRHRLPTTVEMPFSDDTIRILQSATAEADRLGLGNVGVEHLLVGLLRTRGSLAERYLSERGVSVDAVREQIRAERASPAADSLSRPSPREALIALERVSSLLTQIRNSSPADIGDVIEGIELELQLVERALVEPSGPPSRSIVGHE